MPPPLFCGRLSFRAVGRVSEIGAIYGSQRRVQLVFQAVEKESL